MKVRNTVCASTLETLFKSERLSDVTFVVNKRNGVELKIPAHKLILAASSRVFDTTFFGNVKIGPDVAIVDVSAEAFTEFLQFFYVTEVDLTTGNIFEVCRLIENYDVRSGKAVYEHFLKSTVTMDLAFQYLYLALTFNYSIEFIELLVDMIAGMDIEKSRKSPSFLQCSKLALRTILQSEKVRWTELELFEAAISWATASLQRKRLSTTPVYIQAELGECLYLIRFPVMTSNQFLACIQRYSRLFHFEEYMDIVYYITDNRQLTKAAHFSIIPRGSKPSFCGPQKQAVTQCQVIISKPKICEQPYLKIASTSVIAFRVSSQKSSIMHLTGLQIAFRDLINSGSLLILFNRELKLTCRFGEDVILDRDNRCEMCETYNCKFEKAIPIEMFIRNELSVYISTPVRCADLQQPNRFDADGVRFDMMSQEWNTFLTKLFFEK